MGIESFVNKETTSGSNNETYSNKQLFDKKVSETTASFDRKLEPVKSFDFDKRVKVDKSDIDHSKNDIRYSPDNRVGIEKRGSSLEKELSTEEKIKKQNKQIKEYENRGLENLNSQERGKYGEMKTDQDMREKGYVRISKDMLVDDKSELKQGLDGFYEKVGGEPRFVGLDAKYGSSKLGDTLDGKQMSWNWIDKRLDASVGKEKADEIRWARLFNKDSVGSFVSRIDSYKNVSYDKLDDNANVIKKDWKL